MWRRARDTGVKAVPDENKQSLASSGRRGTGDSTEHSTRSKLGNLWIPRKADVPGERNRRETISRREEFRASDEAIVSFELSGHYNPTASQGPLDGRVGVAGSRAILNRKALERVIPLGITYSRERELRWRIRRSHGADVDGT